MFDKIISYSIKNKLVIGILTLGLIAAGWYSLGKLPIDALPDITNNQVQIITTSPNLATQDIELYITYPIELAVKPIAKIEELRSISRFGLSVVTVVFEEGVDPYWARAQITERLKEAEAEIPAGYGKPELAPISTGLGEIYQYTVSAEEGYEDVHDIMDLRSYQDWIIAPQLLGTKGVAEVNTLGGVLKEYEISVNPNKMRSMGVTMSEIFQALENNNENTGGAYIDKKPNAYFIRSVGMVNSLDDIRNTVIKNVNQIPILIRDIGSVNFGSAIRYGATTKDGEGEVVGGMVMMLKGENSAEIVSLVKEKMEQIKSSLPEGVKVVPYLDRTKLVNRAISTVKTNLIEGALIVIFILVLLIGNWRAGLIVATVIPLALLFAVCMMYLFGVSGNLMSLGAIDFGLIVDGAVIIVESIVHRLQSQKSALKLSAKEMDKQVYTAASKIRSSAAFGEIIILIVYLPILALVGIEGKMFKPMAQTVAFAILGAFILSLTYVPMASALFLSKKTGHKENFSDKIIAFFERLYRPVLHKAMKFKAGFLLGAIAIFATALFVFNSLGGEFIPTLNEGDIATHVIIPPGSSLEQEIETTGKAERLLLDNFPNIEQVVSKIGSAEVPTDPMPMEVADVMVIMKDEKDWTDDITLEEMPEKMEEVLDDLPGVTTEFSQPIEMRFNELMTGIRSDVGVKIFGEDVDLLVSLAEEATSMIQTIEGVQDARAETVSGLPQININYNKEKLALYGLNIGDINTTIRMGFAGQSAGVVYEGEKKYDLVVRLEKDLRQSIDDVKNLFISLPSGNQIPLEQIADVVYERGPAQISRENGKRRIIIGFNVRDRDVESVVTEIQDKFKANLELPVGYYVEYAGQFENLIQANKRLSVAVPIALLLIFVLLYFTFKSVKQSILIFTAIPLSAIGGVFALWLRDMPFSISAGVGFIALFGVAVLNGIVLISYFNQLKAEGVSDVLERIHLGTRVRLRPVMMTAAVASLGFLPMALSGSAGAEVQRPLATVVIGGLITATILTLVILPILYYFSENGFKMKTNKALNLIILLACTSLTPTAFGQDLSTLTLHDVEIATLQNNGFLQASLLEYEQQQELKGTAFSVPKTAFDVSIGQMNSTAQDEMFSVSQTFNPFVFRAKSSYLNHQIESAEIKYTLSENQILREVRDLWLEMMVQLAHREIIEEQLQMWDDFVKQAHLKYELGESSFLEKTTVEVKAKDFALQGEEVQIQLNAIKSKLKTLMGRTDDFEPAEENRFPLLDLSIYDSIGQTSNPWIEYYDIMVASAVQQEKIKKAERLPDLSVGYFIQTLDDLPYEDSPISLYNNQPGFQGVTFGLAVPIFGRGTRAEVHAAELQTEIQIARSEYAKDQLETELKNLFKQLEFQQKRLAYYTSEAVPNAKKIAEGAESSYRNGNIGYIEFMQLMEVEYDIKKSYLTALENYQKTYNNLYYLLDIE